MTQIQKCTLVPTRFFDEKVSRCILSDLFPLQDSEQVNHIAVPDHDAVMVYAGDTVPVLFDMISALKGLSEYNKVLVSYAGGVVHIVLAQGEKLLLANSYPALDFTTAQYFIFFAMKSLQLNPEVSTITMMTPLSGEDEMSLYRYFKSVEQI